jgi:16S rRNA (guanine527-N7)-methyltransferase
MFIFTFFFDRKEIFSAKKNLNFEKMKMKTLPYIIIKNIKSNKTNLFKNLSLFCEHFILKNAYTNLISKKTTSFLYKIHLLDALTLMAFIKVFWPRKKKYICLDMGTGGGFPGLILALFTPNFFFFLLDSVNKKTQFHEKIILINKMKNCFSICFRAEKINNNKMYKKSLDIIFSRAMADLPFLIQLCLPFCNFNSKILVMKKIHESSEEIKKSLFFLNLLKGKLKSILFINPEKKGKMIIIIKINVTNFI